MQQAFDLGIAASKTPGPPVARLRSLRAHAAASTWPDVPDGASRPTETESRPSWAWFTRPIVVGLSFGPLAPLRDLLAESVPLRAGLIFDPPGLVLELVRLALEFARLVLER